MRCVDVIRELAAPSAGPSPDGLAEHLDRCPRCASWARRDARLDRLWEATRPPELAPEAWERIWATASEAFDRGAAAERSRVVPGPSSPRPRPWRRSAARAFVLAQAAALVVGFTLLARFGPPRAVTRPGPPEAIAAPVQVHEVEIDQEQVVLIHLEGRDVRVRSLALVENPNTVDPFYSMYNAVEAIAALQ